MRNAETDENRGQLAELVSASFKKIGSYGKSGFAIPGGAGLR